MIGMADGATGEDAMSPLEELRGDMVPGVLALGTIPDDRMMVEHQPVPRGLLDELLTLGIDHGHEDLDVAGPAYLLRGQLVMGFHHGGSTLG